MTHAEQNRQDAIEAAIEPIVGSVSVPGLDDMPTSLNGMRAALFALLNRIGMLEQLVTAKFADMSPRLLLAEQVLASTTAQAQATATLAAFLDSKDSLIETATRANTLDILVLQKQEAADQLALAALQARAGTDEALIAAAQANADAAQFEATMAKGAALAAQAKADAAATAANSAQATADAAKVSAAQAKADLTTLAARFRTKRVATTPVVVGGTMKIDVVWDVPFADDKYNAVPEFEGLALLGLVGTISNRTATGCTISAKNTLGLALLAGAGMVTITAIHDATT